MGGVTKNFGSFRTGRSEADVYSGLVKPPVIAVSPGGLLALAYFDVSVLDLGRKTIRKFEPEMQEGGLSPYEALAFTPNSRIVVAAGFESIDAWNIESGKRVQHSSCECDADGVALSRDGALAVVGTSDAHVLLWDVAAAKLLNDKTVSLVQGDHVYGTAVDLKGSLVAAGTASGSIAIWDTRSGAIVARTQLSSQPITRVVSSDDGQVLLVTGQGETAFDQRGSLCLAGATFGSLP